MQMLKPWRSNSSSVGELSGKMNAGKNAAEAQLVNRVTGRKSTNPISNLEGGEDLEGNWETNWTKGETVDVGYRRRFWR